MEQYEAPEPRRRPDDAGAAQQRGRTGEGAGSAMEQLIQHERRQRDRQPHREGGGAGGPDPSA